MKSHKVLTLREYLALDAAARIHYLQAQRAWLIEQQDKLTWQRKQAIAKRYELAHQRRRRSQLRERARPSGSE